MSSLVLLGDSEGFTDCSFKKRNHLSTTTKKLLFSLTYLLPALACIDSLNKYISMCQETSPENTHRESTENSWLMSCTGSWKFNEQLSHRKRGTEVWSQKETDWEDQDILLSSSSNHQISHFLEKTLSVLKT